MMTRLLTIILSLTVSTAKPDMGPPYIQAVCRVKTLDGKTYEGFVSLINGGYDGVRPNGFYFYQDDNSNWVVPFDYEFHKLERKDSTKYKIGNFQPEAKNLYFLVHIRDDENAGLTQTKQRKQDHGNNFLTTKTIVQRKYLMLDTLPLFTELPEELLLNYANKKLKRFNIPMKDIVSFEIGLQAGTALLSEIEKKTRKKVEIENAANSSGDTSELRWAHELVKDPEYLKTLKEEFLKWHRE